MKRATVVALCFIACAKQPTTPEPVVATPEVTPSAVTEPEPPLPPLIPRTELFAASDHRSPLLSPDGRQLAWIAPLDGVSNIWVASVSDLATSRALTRDKGNGIAEFRWAYDNKHVLYGQDQGGNENVHIMVLDVATGVSRDATAFQNVKGSYVGVSPAHRNSVLVGLNRREPEWEDVFELDLDKGILRPIYENKAKVLNLHASDDFKWLVGEHLNDDGSKDLVLVDLAKKKPKAPRVLAKVPFADQATTSVRGFSSDGRTLYLDDSRGRDTSALMAMDLSNGATRLLADDPRCDVRDVIVHPATHAPQVALFEYDIVTNVMIDSSVAADITTLRAVDKGTVTWSATLDDRQWTVTFAGEDTPPRYYLYDRDTREARYLFSARTALEKEQLAHRRTVIITARDGVQLVSYLTLPTSVGDADRPEQPLPLVLAVHGGPWWRDSQGYEPVAQWLANRGYAVLQANFRGSTGFGKRFINLANRGWGGTMQDDLVDAVTWAQSTFITAPGKVAIFGASYGGYATLVGMTRDPQMFECGVDIMGVSNLETFIAAIPPYWKPYLNMIYEQIGDPRTPEGQAFLRERSPLTNAQAIEKPLFIAQGANDPRVKLAESAQLVAELGEHHIPVSYAVFPDEGHGFTRPANRLVFFGMAEGFLARCLHGRNMTMGNEIDGNSMLFSAGPQ